jgi:hypothetical protein
MKTDKKILYVCETNGDTNCFIFPQKTKGVLTPVGILEFKNHEKVMVKCSSCGVEAVSLIPENMCYPFTCGNCDKCSMEYFGNLKDLTTQRNKWNRRIATLKKTTFQN